ncbi:hypothetical protein SAMN02745225_00248 [Ferrithrix thermotolerans DSM 19514]|uniref:Uncharacterized protein n=1 Tax=Ferrithrix thermotolerans DSM 19514 TaxID=1121881 RepID=A0A1M4SF39_9ACTN|nr:hypothetical protein SAMN02745225_00248 [Ferrithrix thermotolerans DSM 19514]
MVVVVVGADVVDVVEGTTCMVEAVETDLCWVVVGKEGGAVRPHPDAKVATVISDKIR